MKKHNLLMTIAVDDDYKRITEITHPYTGWNLKPSMENKTITIEELLDMVKVDMEYWELSNDKRKLKNKIEDNQVRKLLEAIRKASEQCIREITPQRRIKKDKVECITLESLKNRRKRKELVFARMIFSHNCIQDYTYQAIADYMCLRSHAAVYSHVKKFLNDYDNVEEFRDFSDAVKKIMDEQNEYDRNN